MGRPQERCTPEEHARRAPVEDDGDGLILAAATFAALAEPTRLRIVLALSVRPMNVKTLAAELARSASLVSKHLAVLRSARIVDARRRGQVVTYTLRRKDAVAWIAAALATRR